MNNTAGTTPLATDAEAAPLATNAPSRRRRMLLPLAGLLGAAALVVGSGADFVSSSVNEGNAYTTGTLTQSNSKANSAIFNMDDLKPGDTVTGGVEITNSGSLPASFKLTEDATNGFADPANLQLSITDGSDETLYSGTFGALTDGEPLDLGDWEAGESRDFTFSVTLDQSAGNEEQGKTAGGSYTWDAVQAEATTYDQ
ncbi:M73 family metallopeptidase [Nesterenkonia sp. Act20]|uniref:M73 family metallopeptidase n=1 Tax=Nesterenkonia sp. Act20 TaxID=1483432 RepID=UPI001C436D57|nr:M73 family metallopeptidase [Nesterenkonia sp. Act20]